MNPNNGTFAYATYIATTPEKLWEALTTGDFTRKYWFGREVRSDWEEGSAVVFVDESGQTTDAGTVLKCEPYRLLSYTLKCVHDDTEYVRQPTVTIRLIPMESAVKLVLKHEWLSPGAFRGEEDGFIGIDNGWPAILSNLKSLLETGRALPAVTLQDH
ncbi:SRPBCC family protein [Cohnella zeiphila]|uniref:SRPBCC family protein n=1 Tax=Cohnella zeiphila TaxID=2761120 RepID=A0A7X0SI29_9BACL|nr:SRPBCC family protein [Cohnella zeiphila]MBB6730396.1 SRPBCC family protein [Cohnella zeiphila]